MTTTLLAVDDSKTMRRVLEITFSGETQFKTVLADSAQDALAKLSAVQPRVALVDVSLPDQNGYDLCRQIKAQAPNVSVLVLSSKQQPYDRTRGSAAGADDFIDKPFDTQQLLDKVTQLASQPAAAVVAAVAAPAVAPPMAAPAAAPISAAQPIAFGARPMQAPSAASGSPAHMAAGTHSAGAYGTGASSVAGSSPLGSGGPASASSRAPGMQQAIPQGSQQDQRRIVSSPPPKPKSMPAPVLAAAQANGAQMQKSLADLGLTAQQIDAVMALSRDVVERVVWEVVPVLAETMIREEIQRLTAEG